MQKLLIFLLIHVLFSPKLLIAQEKEPEINVEDSAEVFLEDYSDDFQEHFFEGLKQKGIENYDRAINLLLKCKELEPDNDVVDHELAKAYLLDEKYNLAVTYGINAVVSERENIWYLETLVTILQKQGRSIEAIATEIPFDNTKLQENLVLIYFKNKSYDEVLYILKKLKKTPFLDDLALKISDSIKKIEGKGQNKNLSKVDNTISNPLLTYKTQLKGFIQTSNYLKLQQVSEEALETYPSQPYFYYAQGYALNKTENHANAIEILEAALDFLIADRILANKIYAVLGEAYNGINNSVKANMYLRKIKLEE